MMEKTGARDHVRMIRLATAAAAVAITVSLAATIVPGVMAEASTGTATFDSRLAANAGVEKFATLAVGPIPATTHARTETYIAPPAPAAPPQRTSRSRSGGSATAAVPSSGGDLQSILNGYIAKYPILAGATATYGDAKGYQAIAYYKSGRIVVSPTHTASLQRIIGHEIWHIIDWRDNGIIDWGENVPPR
ncbi:MAG: hypothetical protein ACYCXZ_01165 [Coriobacteriia bacterium]